MKSKDPGAEELYRLYVTEDKTAKEIAAMCGAGLSSVQNWLGAYDIHKGGRHGQPDNAMPDIKELRRLYIGKNMTRKEIAGVYGVSEWRVSQWVRAAGLKKHCGARKNETINDDEIRRLYVDGGMSAAAVAEEISAYPRTVLRRLRAMGVLRPSIRSAPVEPPDKEVLRELYFGQGLGEREIGEIYGVSASVVCRWFKNAGIQGRRGGSHRNPAFAEPPEAELCRLRKEGHTQREIAEILGISKSAVRSRMIRYGISTDCLPERPAGWKKKGTGKSCTGL